MKRAFLQAVLKMIKEKKYGMNIDKNKLQELVVVFLEDGTYSDLKELESLLNIKINPTPKTVQNIYAKLLDELKIEEINELYKNTGVVPKFSERDLQKAYRKLGKEGRSWDISTLKTISGIEPVLDRNATLLAARKLIKKGDYSEAASLLRRIIIDKSDLQSMYDVLIKKAEVFGISEIRRATGISPTIDEADAKKIMQKLVKTGRIRDIISLSEMTGARPVIDEKYYEIMMKKSMFNELNALEKITGVSKNSVVEKFLNESVLDGNIASAKNLYDITGTKPSISYEQLDAVCSKLMNAGHADKAKILCEMIGVSPRFKAGTVQKLYEKFFKEGNMKAISDLHITTQLDFENHNIKLAFLLYSGQVKHALNLYNANKEKFKNKDLDIIIEIAKLAENIDF